MLQELERSCLARLNFLGHLYFFFQVGLEIRALQVCYLATFAEIERSSCNFQLIKSLESLREPSIILLGVSCRLEEVDLAAPVHTSLGDSIVVKIYNVNLFLIFGLQIQVFNESELLGSLILTQDFDRLFIIHDAEISFRVNKEEIYALRPE
jgi:hypothetical protein